MSRFFSLLFAVVSLCGVGLLIPKEILAEESQLIEFIQDSWCPYTCSPADKSPGAGLLIEFVTEAFRGAGLSVSVSFAPFSRAIKAVEQGEKNGIIGVYSSDVPGFVLPQRPVMFSQNKVFSPASFLGVITSLEDLQKYSIGLIQDYTYGEKLDEYVGRVKGDSKKVQFASGEQAVLTNVKKLFGGRIDLMVEDDLVVKYALASQGRSVEIKDAAPGFFEEQGVFIAFSPKGRNSKKYAEILDSFGARPDAATLLKSLRKKYGVD